MLVPKFIIPEFTLSAVVCEDMVLVLRHLEELKKDLGLVSKVLDLDKGTTHCSQAHCLVIVLWSMLNCAISELPSKVNKTVITWRGSTTWWLYGRHRCAVFDLIH